MGSKPKKIVKKIIPKEIKPAVPFIAAYFGGPALGAKMFGVGPAALTSGQLAVSKGLTAALASKIQGDDTKSALRSGIFAAAPDVISGGLQKAGATLSPQTTQALKKTLTMSNVGSNAVPVSQQIGSILSSAGQSLASTGYTPGNAISFKDAAKVIGGQAVSEAGARAVELNKQAIRDYEEQLRSQGITDSAERRNQIFGYFSRAGYADDEINSMLDKYGYKKGGRVEKTDLKGFGEKYIEFIKQRENAANGGRIGFDRGGRSRDPRIAVLVSSLLEKGMNLEDALNLVDEEFPEDFDSSNLMSGLGGIMSGYQLATGQPLMGLKPQPTRFGLAEGGVSITDEGRSGVIYRDEQGNPISKEEFLRRTYEEEFRDTKAEGGLMSLRAGGMPAEMDMRGGGFIPIGQRERADDVPARLSKNEFVMTADAVRAAGDGNINKGAKRMYDLMNKLEART